MFLIASEQALVEAFRPRDRTSLELPEGLAYPYFVRDYFSWGEAAGVRTFLVFQDPASKRPLGISFRCDRSEAKGLTGRLCDWCHAYGSAEEIGLLTAEKTSKRLLGVGLCRDLRCGEKLEQAANLAGRSALESRRRLVERMQRFAREGLGIEAVP